VSSPSEARPSLPATPLRILHIGMELAPWASTGGTSEVLAELPAAQSRQGDRVTVVVPFHGTGSWPRHELQTVEGANAALRLGDQRIPFKLGRLRHPAGFEVITVRSELFERGGIYNHPDTGVPFDDSLLRASVLCHAALYYALTAGGRWQVIHGHDAEGALACALLGRRFQPTPLQHARSVLTLHDVGRLGLLQPDQFQYTGMPTEDAAPGGPFELDGQLSTLKAGLLGADWVHTLSPTYARELRNDPAIGGPLHDVFRSRGERVVGVVGGLDLSGWNPSTDPYLAASFDINDLSGRDICREDLESLAQLKTVEAPEPRPVIVGVIGRLLRRRGMDLLADAIPRLIGDGFFFVVQADGDPDLESSFTSIAARYPGRVHVRIGWEPETARQVLAGADLYCMPSRYEPNGMAQQYAMRYAALPVVRRTGSLADTVPDDVGILFDEMTTESLCAALREGGAAVRDEEERRSRQLKAMSLGTTWDQSAAMIRDQLYLEGR